MMSSEGPTTTSATASMPSLDRLPRPGSIMAEQFATGGVWERGALRGRSLIVLLSAGLLYAAFYAWRTHENFGSPGGPVGDGSPDRLLFFPGMSHVVLAAAIFAGVYLWIAVPRAFLLGLPVRRTRHQLLRVTAVWIQFLLIAAIILASGAFYALLVGYPARYLVELLAYLPVIMVSASILYIVAAAMALLGPASSNWHGFMFLVALLLLVALGFLADGAFGSVGEHMALALGLAPVERLGEFPYGAWLAAATPWAFASVCALYLAARRYRDIL
jgi:hypothetical protein